MLTLIWTEDREKKFEFPDKVPALSAVTFCPCRGIFATAPMSTAVESHSRPLAGPEVQLNGLMDTAEEPLPTVQEFVELKPATPSKPILDVVLKEEPIEELDPDVEMVESDDVKGKKDISNGKSSIFFSFYHPFTLFLSFPFIEFWTFFLTDEKSDPILDVEMTDIKEKKGKKKWENHSRMSHLIFHLSLWIHYVFQIS